MRLDSRARTTARRRRGISNGFATLAIKAITTNHAGAGISQRRRSFEIIRASPVIKHA